MQEGRSLLVLVLSRGSTHLPAFQEGTIVDDGTDNDVGEEEADTFAADFLIPTEHKQRLLGLTTDREVADFAGEIGIVPGIVVGRLQYEQQWGWNQGNSLQRGLRIAHS